MNNIKFFKKSILYEDNHLIIINKKPGELTQGDKTKDQTLGDKVKEYIKKKYDKPGNVYLGITHRLDRPTSGIIIFCKTSIYWFPVSAYLSKCLDKIKLSKGLF